jgi:hypothetical protein
MLLFREFVAILIDLCLCIPSIACAALAQDFHV